MEEIAEKNKETKILIYFSLFLIILLTIIVRMPTYNAESFLGGDSYWHYRHASEILDHGFPGTEMRYCADGEFVCSSNSTEGKLTPYDTLHNAPDGAKLWNEFYYYFSAYSYKYFGQYVTPSLFTTCAGLFSLSMPFLFRSLASWNDTDALVIFLLLFTVFLFARAWEFKSYKYGIASGFSMGLLGITWAHGYSFIPPTFGVAIIGYFIINVLKERSILNTIKKDLDRYLISIIFMVIALSMVAVIISPMYANPWLSIEKLNIINEDQTTEGIKNVFSTITELQKPTVRETISKLHFSIVLSLILFSILLPFGLYDKLKELGLFTLLLFSSFTLVFLFSTIVASRFIVFLSIPLILFSGIAIAELLTKIKVEQPLVSGEVLKTLAIVFVIISLLFVVPDMPAEEDGNIGYSYFGSGIRLAEAQTFEINDNWNNYFKWAKENTEEGAVVATWWDYGHMITAMAERPAVTDGNQYQVSIHDMAVFYTTTNKVTALEIMKKYNVSYVITTSHLFNLYPTICFLADEKIYIYETMPLYDTALDVNSLRTYYYDYDTVIQVKEMENDIKATMKRGAEKKTIARIFYEKDEEWNLDVSKENNTLDALLFLDRDYAIFLPPDIENNMLTELQIFDAKNLEHFKLVKNFNNQVIVFEVIY